MAIQTAYTRVLRPRRAAPADAVRPTRAEINLEALRHNLRVLQRHAGDCAVWAVLKADAYGHGAPAVARTLERAKVGGFCVALLEEAIELREAGIVAPILVMGGYYGNAHDEVVAHQLIPVVYDNGQIEAFSHVARTRSIAAPIDVHVKVDTGMARLGLSLDKLGGFAQSLRTSRAIRVTGLMTHLACAEAEDQSATVEQLARFGEATRILRSHGIVPSVRHAANSAALLRASALQHPNADERITEVGLEMARPGIALFGCDPRVDVASSESYGAGELRAVMRVRTEIVDLRQLNPGDPVGYGGLWRAPRASLIATIPMGYTDGLSRQLTNTGQVLVRGVRARIVGAVSMDMAMIDVTDVAGVRLRDEVVVLGRQEGPLGKDAIGIHEMAHAANAIPWEVLTSISRRVPRFYRET